MSERATTIINAKRKTIREKWRHMMDYRELLLVLALKDIRVKYAQTFIGISWSFITPIFTVLVLTFVFKKVADIEVGEVPHTIFTMAGLIGWSYFSRVVETAGSSLIGAQQMVKKIYFPRIFIPLSKAIAALLNFVITFICLIVLMLAYGAAPSSNIVFLPFFILMAIMAGVGVSIWISALSIRFRDLIHVIPIALRLGMFVTPIAYPIREVGPKFKLLFHLNPMTGVVEAIRWSILDSHHLHRMTTYVSFGIILILFISGIMYFNSVERRIADVI